MVEELSEFALEISATVEAGKVAQRMKEQAEEPAKSEA